MSNTETMTVVEARTALNVAIREWRAAWHLPTRGELARRAVAMLAQRRYMHDQVPFDVTDMLYRDAKS